MSTYELGCLEKFARQPNLNFQVRVQRIRIAFATFLNITNKKNSFCKYWPRTFGADKIDLAFFWTDTVALSLI